jgi:hypothetical protein
MSNILNARVWALNAKSPRTSLRVFAEAWPPSSAYQSPQAVQRLNVHLDRVQIMLREGRPGRAISQSTCTDARALLQQARSRSEQAYPADDE